DATVAPFRSDTFGGAYLRWVLHLVPAWQTLLEEMIRVVRPGGVFLALVGYYEGPRAEIQERFGRIVGYESRPVGLDWGSVEELDRAMAALGAHLRLPPSFTDVEPQRVPEFLD